MNYIPDKAFEEFIQTTVQQIQDMYIFVSDHIVLILSLNIPVSVFFWLVRKSIVSGLDLQMKKKKNVLVFFSLQYGQICFWWDHSSETIQSTCLIFQRRYMCIVSGKWDSTNTRDRLSVLFAGTGYLLGGTPHTPQEVPVFWQKKGRYLPIP
jgi:hypothetical protein